MSPPAERRRADAVHRVPAVMAAIRDRLAVHPLATTGGLAALLLAVAAVRLYAPLPGGTWPAMRDSVIFEYIGWFLTEGNRLYLDVWEMKPPLAFELTAIVSLVAGENVGLYHSLNIALTGGAIVLGAMAAAGIVHELTGDPLGAVVAGVGPFVLPFFVYRPLLGFKSKYFVIATGLGCLYLAHRERPGLAGVVGAAAVGFWQLAVVFPLCGLGLCWQTRGLPGAIRFLGAGVLAGAVMGLPVVVWGAVPAMVAEVVLAPLLVTRGHTAAVRLDALVQALGASLPIALVGVVAIASPLANGLMRRRTGAFPSAPSGDRLRREWPLVVALGWFTLQLVAVDFDATPDLFPWLAIAAVGLGLAIGDPGRFQAVMSQGRRVGIGRDTARRVLAGTVLVVAALSTATGGGLASGGSVPSTIETFDVPDQPDPGVRTPQKYDATERQYVFWHRVDLPTCRSFGAYTQSRLIRELGMATDRHWVTVPCGQFGPMWRALWSG